MNLKQKTQKISDALEKLYGIPEREENENVLDCLIRTVLSQNTNDINRDKGFTALQERFPYMGRGLQSGCGGDWRVN